jgi:hypothetical protein
LSEKLASNPSEDAGHDTASYYRFQYSVTVLECLQVLLNGMGSVVVEWHTDIVRRYATSSPDSLISVKHRTPDRGPWSFSALTKDVLATLFMRWKALGSTDQCCVVTNGGFKTGVGESRRLVDALRDSNSELINEYAQRIVGDLGAADATEALSFLGCLAVKEIGATQEAIAAHVIENYCRPTLMELGISPTWSKQVFDEFFKVVYSAASGYEDARPQTWAPWTDWTEAVLRSRTIDYAGLCSILAGLGVVVDEVAAKARRNGAAPDTVMLRKLKQGGLGPSVEAGAPHLRAHWFALESRYKQDIPIGSADEISRIRKVVLAKALYAESAARSGDVYGLEMHGLLMDQLSSGAVATSLQIDVADLLGCAYQLTDECHIWWSDRFDPYSDNGTES